MSRSIIIIEYWLAPELLAAVVLAQMTFIW
jgi:hypothetical protein